MIISCDWGGTLIKIVVKETEKGNNIWEYNIFKENFPYDYINNKIKEYDSDDVTIILTGARQNKVIKDRFIKGNIVQLEEIKSIGSVIHHCGYDSGLVVSLGTGTPFVFNDGKEIKHVSGTGLGGGTLIGLAQRLIGETDPDIIEHLALEGDLAKVNIMMSDITDNTISWLKQDYTCSNFAKLKDNLEENEDKRDLALGIHSLIAEPVGVLAAACAIANNTKTVIFVGMLSENKVIQRILDVCLGIYGMKGIYPEHSGFGTCLGAITLYEGTD